MKKEALVIIIVFLLVITFKQVNAQTCDDYCVSGTEIMNCFASESGTGCDTFSSGCCCIQEACPGGGNCEGNKCVLPCTFDAECGGDICSRYGRRGNFYYKITHGTCNLGTGDCEYTYEYCSNYGANYICDTTDPSKGCYDSCAGVTCGANYCSGATRYYNSYCSYGNCYWYSQTCTYGCSNGACITCEEQQHAEECNNLDDDCNNIIDEGADDVAGSVCCVGITCNTYCTSSYLYHDGYCSWGTCSYSTTYCGADGYAGLSFCKNDDVYRTYRDRYCDANTLSCLYTDTDKLIQDCPYICVNGVCKVCIEGSERSCNLQGVCAQLKQTCVNNAWTPCPGYETIPSYQTTETLCDGLDNDCDGTTDEGCPCQLGTTKDCGYDANGDGVVNANDNIGQCQTGTQQCLFGGVWGNCIGSYGPTPETCDNMDNDCDGIIDEEVMPRACPLQQGVCAGAQQTCSQGAWQTCDYGPDYESSEKSCDGLDNDCDGKFDNVKGTTNPLIQECGIDDGICQKGTQTCISSTWGSCGGNYIGPMEEACDGFDNDCDGRIDNGVLNNCVDYTTCIRYDTCNQCPLPPSEICGDGIDNNCNSQTDEGCTCQSGEIRSCGMRNCIGTMSCINNQWSACSSKDKDCGVCCICDAGGSETYDDLQDMDCGSTTCPPNGCGAGNCGTHIWAEFSSSVLNKCLSLNICTQNQCEATCETDEDGDEWSLSCGDSSNDPDIYPDAQELCDNKDNNLDGKVDEELIQSCGTDIGACKSGKKNCLQGGWGPCLEAIEPVSEICNNGADDNCDGSIDENCVCTNGETQECGIDTGECQKGLQLCIDNAWSDCIGEIPPVREVCNQLDDNCDGLVDEGLSECLFLCGNGVCDLTESCDTCSYDCGGCKEPVKDIEITFGLKADRITTQIFSVVDLNVIVKNVAPKTLNNVKVKLDVPKGWQVTEQHIFKELLQGEKKNVSFKFTIPDAKMEQGIVRLSVNASERYRYKMLPVFIDIPDFIVAPEPSLISYAYQDQVVLNTIVNNKNNKDFEDLEVEINFNKGRTTYVADMSTVYNVKAGEIFLVKNAYPLDYLGGSTYNIRSFLFQKGKKVDESNVAFDLTK